MINPSEKGVSVGMWSTGHDSGSSELFFVCVNSVSGCLE